MLSFQPSAHLVEWYKGLLLTYKIQIQNHIESKDYDSLYEVAHKIKGSAGLYGFPSLTVLAKGLMLEASKQSHMSVESVFSKIDEITSKVPLLNENQTKVDGNCVLVIDDDLAIGAVIKEALAQIQIQCTTCQSVAAAKKLMLEHRYKLILLDYRMPEESGKDFLNWADENKIKTKIVVMSAAPEVKPELNNSSAFSFMAKPFSLETLYGLVPIALEH